jgi:hypothetical protein
MCALTAPPSPPVEGERPPRGGPVWRLAPGVRGVRTTGSFYSRTAATTCSSAARLWPLTNASQKGSAAAIPPTSGA